MTTHNVPVALIHCLESSNLNTGILGVAARLAHLVWTSNGAEPLIKQYPGRITAYDINWYLLIYRYSKNRNGCRG